MTRSVRDLREIINVSRLSIRDDNSDDYSDDGSDISIDECSDSDDLSDYIVSRPSTAMERSSFRTPCVKRPNSAVIRVGNDLSSLKISRSCTALPKRDKNMNITRIEASGRNTVSVVDDPSRLKIFPSKYSPVPPIGKTNELKNPFNQCISSSDKSQVRSGYKHDALIKKGNRQIDTRNDPLVTRDRKNVDEMFQYVDATILSSWLEECNHSLDRITQYMREKHNFVDFAQFFLTQMEFIQYCELLDLEFSIILDQFRYAFHSGLTNGKINDSDLSLLARAVIKEYPYKLKREKRGAKLLLDTIMIFCSGKTNDHRRLLKDVHCSTCNKQNVQYLLAIRAFGLISFITGVLKFYENVVNVKDVYENKKVMDGCHDFHINDLIFQAVNRDYLHVLDYFFTNQKVGFHKIFDDKKRNLVSIAVSSGKYEALHYLLNLSKKIDVNGISENGNTPLQCAVTYNDLQIASSLLQHDANVNAWNEQAEGATALHMAVMLGSTEMAKLLLQNGADKTALMGIPATIDALSLAKDMNHVEIIQLLENPL